MRKSAAWAILPLAVMLMAPMERPRSHLAVTGSGKATEGVTDEYKAELAREEMLAEMEKYSPLAVLPLLALIVYLARRRPKSQ